VHISELADFRVKRTEDVVKVGDMIWVKCIGIDDKGRVKLSRKAALKERAEYARVEIVDEPQDSGGSAAASDRGYKDQRGYQSVATRVL
jgi:predicted RNA-binding protein with RPS1 domain